MTHSSKEKDSWSSRISRAAAHVSAHKENSLAQELQEQNHEDEKLKEVLDKITEGIFLLSSDFKIIWANKEALKQTGANLADIKRSYCYSVTHNRKTPCQAPYETCPIEESLKTGSAATFVHEHVSKMGEKHFAEVSAYPIRNEKGETVQFVHFTKDITKRKRMEEELRENEKRLRDIIFNMGEWVWEVDENGVYTYSSEKGFDFLGRTREEVIGKTPFDFMPPEEARRMEAIFSELVIRKSPIRNLENWNLHKNGKKVCLLTNAVPILDENKNLKGYRGVDKDITQLKQDEIEMAELWLELSHLGRVSAMNEISTSLAHEINQPLSAVLNNASTAKLLISQGKGGRKEYLEILEDIAKDAKRAADIIRKIRAFLKKSELEFGPLQLNDLIVDVVDLYRHNFDANQISLCLDLAPGIEDVNGDRVHLQQLLSNLITNAVDAMSDTKSKILKIRSAMETSDKVTVSVSDSGKGIDQVTKAKMFDPFFTTKKDGLGMGLRICRSIIEEHGGRIWVERNQSSGVTFSFSLDTIKKEVL